MLIFKPHQAFDILAPLLPDNPIIIEAGSFTGQDTIKMALRWPQGTIYAFEPVPEIFEQLDANTKAYPNIICHQLALSNTAGHATFYKAIKESGATTQAGSLVKPIPQAHHFQFSSSLRVETSTLDQWAAKQNVTHIDCLWLDLQGHELAVLQGAEKQLANIRALHLEVNFVPRYENQPLYADIAHWLTQHGFQEYARDFIDQSRPFGNVIAIRT